MRAARGILIADQPAIPRASGEREALRALLAAREGAVSARTAAYCQLRDLLITTPEPLRSQLRPLSRARLLARLTAARPDRRSDCELRGSQLALKAVARRIQRLTSEERELVHEIERLAPKLAPQLLDQPGIGPLLAAQIVLSWSHRGRLRMLVAGDSAGIVRRPRRSRGLIGARQGSGRHLMLEGHGPELASWHDRDENSRLLLIGAGLIAST